MIWIQCAQFGPFSAQFLHSGSFYTKNKNGQAGAVQLLKILQTRGQGICQRPKARGEKYAGKSRLGMVNQDFSKGGDHTNHLNDSWALCTILYF